MTPPYWRGDVAIAADLVEEVARVVGYDRVRAQIPAVAPQDIDSADFDRESELATTCAALGYTEALTLSLQSGAVAERWRECSLPEPYAVEIVNPLSEDQRWMRFSLVPALLELAARDRAVRPYRIFELGHVFRAQGDGPGGDPEETVVLTLLHAGGPSAFSRLSSDVKLLLRRMTGVETRVEPRAFAALHPGKTAALHSGDAVVGYAGVIDPRLARAYEVAGDTALATIFVQALPARTTPAYAPPSRFPPVDRDLAVVVSDDVLAGNLIEAVRLQPLVRSVTVFDEYRGPQIGAGKKSLALRIVLQSDASTLTDEDADAAIARIVTELRERFEASLRA